MRKIFTLLMSFTVALASAQTNTPASVTELAASGNSLEKTNTLKSQPLKSASASTAAGITYYNSRAVFDGDFPGLPVEGFENGNVPDNNVISFAAPLNASTNNSAFNPGDILPGIEFTTSNPSYATAIVLIGTNYAGVSSKVALANVFGANYVMNFNPAVEAVGMDVVSIFGGSSATIEIYDINSNLLASTTAACSPSGSFWGVTSDTPIGKIIIHDPALGAEGADNIAFGSAPLVVPVSGWAIYLVFFLIIASTVFRFRKSIFSRTRA